MKSITKVLLFSLFVILAGFTAVNELIPDPKTSTINNEDIDNSVKNDKIMEHSDPIGTENLFIPNTIVLNYIDIGQMKTSWYGPRFNGRVTANGEIFDQESLTAAHKSLPFGTLLKLINPINNKTVIVRINDRGPFIRGRQLDISKAAAESLDIIEPGVQKLIVEQITLNGANFPVIPFN